ncbi:hypothetical protein [Hydrogenophilus thermoluteolus]|uniref:hypothetical protein n=1 Tax=Hydrogenophilus thermoluteolus TaxID=297 RepID=UPI003F6735F3
MKLAFLRRPSAQAESDDEGSWQDPPFDFDTSPPPSPAARRGAATRGRTAWAIR